MEIFKLFGSIFVDTDKADKSIQKTEGLASKLGNGMKTVVQTGLKVAAGVGAIATAAGTALVSVTENTREYRNEMAKLDTAFQAAEHSTELARTTYKGLQRLLGETDQAVEAANHLAELCNTQEELTAWTDICTGVYAKFGASLPIEGLTEAANETAKVGKLTGSLADALNWAGVNEEAFQAALDKCSTEQERQRLITETLNGLYKETADLYNKNNEAVLRANEAQERINAAMAAFGEIVEPVVSKAKESFAGFLENLVPIADLIANNLIQKMLDIADDVRDFWDEKLRPAISNVGDALKATGEAFEPVIQGFTDMFPESEKAVSIFSLFKEGCLALEEALLWVAEKLTLFSSWITNNQSLVESIIIVIGSFTAAWHLVNGAVTLWNAIAGTATGVTTGLGAAIGFLTSPIGLAVVAVGALIAIGVSLYKNWDVVKAKALELWSKVTETFENIKTAVGIIVDAMGSAFENTVDSMRVKAIHTFNDLVNGILSKVMEIKEGVSAGIEFVKGLFDFEWSLPDIKLPHFNISGGFSLNPLEVPSIGVEWFDKAMNQPMILDEATIFGINSEGVPMGAGETGSEVVSGTQTLMNMISTAIASQNEAMIAVLYMILEAILQMDKNMGGHLREALIGMSWKINDREVARWIREVLA